jgi:hypothetical protein
MGNPHPTASKPIKIGRKHTGALGLRAKGRMQSRAILERKKTLNKFRKYKASVSEFWRGERETFPPMPTNL